MTKIEDNASHETASFSPLDGKFLVENLKPKSLKEEQNLPILRIESVTKTKVILRHSIDIDKKFELPNYLQDSNASYVAGNKIICRCWNHGERKGSSSITVTNKPCYTYANYEPITSKKFCQEDRLKFQAVVLSKSAESYVVDYFGIVKEVNKPTFVFSHTNYRKGEVINLLSRTLIDDTFMWLLLRDPKSKRKSKTGESETLVVNKFTLIGQLLQGTVTETCKSFINLKLEKYNIIAKMRLEEMDNSSMVQKSSRSSNPVCNIARYKVGETISCRVWAVLGPSETVYVTTVPYFMNPSLKVSHNVKDFVVGDDFVGIASHGKLNKKHTGCLKIRKFSLIGHLNLSKLPQKMQETIDDLISNCLFHCKVESIEDEEFSLQLVNLLDFSGNNCSENDVYQSLKEKSQLVGKKRRNVDDGAHTGGDSYSSGKASKVPKNQNCLLEPLSVDWSDDEATFFEAVNQNSSLIEMQLKEQSLDCVKQSSEESFKKTSNDGVSGHVDTIKTADNSLIDKFEIGIKLDANDVNNWISYIEYYIKVSNVVKVRQISNQAIGAIDDLLYEEKLQVWMKLLEAELKLGTSESLQDTFSLALQRNNPMKVYLNMASLYESVCNFSKAVETYKMAVKKHKSNKIVWTKYMEFLFKNRKFKEAGDLLSASFSSLTNKEHTEIILKSAQFEFQYGEIERGKTTMENLLSTYPKRSDFWMAYVDLLISVGEYDVCRTVFSRIFTLGLNDFKLKPVCKKFVDFERSFGTKEQHEAAVEKLNSLYSKQETDD